MQRIDGIIMYIRQQAKQEVLTALKKAIGKGFTLTVDDLEDPREARFGDVAFVCFGLAKDKKRNPNELAIELAAKIGPSKYIETIKAVGPYVNFTFNKQAFSQAVLEEIGNEKDKYGANDTGKGKSIVVDYAQPNTHKEFHVGHIRNAVYGQSIVNIARENGYKVVGVTYIGDIGAHVAKALWAFQKFHRDEIFNKQERAKKLGEMYVQANRYLEEHPEVKLEMEAVQRALEEKQEPLHSLWEKTRKWSIQEFEVIFQELNVAPDVWYFESDVEEIGKKRVQKMLTDGIAKKSEGAIIMDLADEGLGVFLLLKSDGAALYSTKDIELAFRKEKEYHADRQIFVVDIRQSLYFKQLFASLKKVGFKKQLTHLAYDFVNLPEGTISSRSGNVVTYEQLRDAMRVYLIGETSARHADWSKKKVEKTVGTIATAAMSFMMLRQDPESIITFDMKEAMSFDGFTGPYILYTVARIESLLRKSKQKAKVQSELLTHPLEIELVRQLAGYPEVVLRVGQNFAVSVLALWIFETAKIFNEYYHEVRVLDDANKNRISARLAMINAVKQTLVNALKLLCIDTVNEM